MLLTRRPTPERLEELLADQVEQQPTYPEIGSTQATNLPAGYQHDRYAVRLGGGPALFERGSEGLRRWVAHAGAGIRVMPSDAPVVEGGTVLLVLPVGPLGAIAACRIVYVVDEPSRFGFGYGTLPLHPEQGEESFLIERDNDGSVWFRVAAFSRPRDILARVASPVSRLMQHRVTKRYLQAMAHWAARDP